MSDTNWDLAPEGATEIKSNGNIMRFFNSEGQWWNRGLNDWNHSQSPYEWKTIATRPQQTKTVADEPHFKATRENLEQIAKDCDGGFVEVQEGEKWTHTTSLGKCRVLIDTPDEHGYVVIEGDGDGYSLVPPRSLKPIKPKLSKDAMKAVERFAYSLMDKESYDLVSEVNSFREYHDII